MYEYDAEKATTRPVNRTTTKGAIGSDQLYLDGNADGELWLTNGISVSGGGQSLIFSASQVGRLMAGADTLNQRMVIKPKDAYFTWFDNRLRLFGNPTTLYVQQGDGLTKIYETNDRIDQYAPRQSSVWMRQLNHQNAQYELVEYDLLTKTQRRFSKDNTPQLSQTIGPIVVDSPGNLWVWQYNLGLFALMPKSNGQQWTNVPRSSVPFSSVSSYGADAMGNFFVLGSPTNATGSRLWRYDGQVWREIGQLPTLTYPLGDMVIDKQGIVWLYGTGFQAIRFNPCGAITTPKVVATKNSIEVGEAVTLKAEGCSSAIWSWSSVAGSTTDLLQKATNELTVTPTASTTYRVRCYDEGCSGSEATTSVAVRPRLSVAKVNKTIFCINDRLTATLSLTGSVEAGNQYIGVLKSATQTVRTAPVSTTADVSIPITASLAAGRYVFYIESTKPAVRSVDSVAISVVVPALARPSAAKPIIEIGETTTLKAEGCTSAIWSWSSAVETRTNQLVQGSNQLSVSPTANTTYRVRCYDSGCSGDEVGLSLTVLPRLNVGRLRKATYCPGDSILVPISVAGYVEAGNQYRVLLRSGTQSTTLAVGTLSPGGGAIPLPTTLPTGAYILFAEATRPAMRSRDSVLVNVAALPTAKLSTTRPMLNPGDSTQIVVTLTGTPPWRFTRWDGQLVQAATSPYTGWFRATPQGSFMVGVSSLSDANCATGTLKNTLTLSLILGNEPYPGNDIMVSPNPTTGIVRIDASGSVLITAVQLYDLPGRVVQQLTSPKPTWRQSLDLGTLPAGIYLLRVQTDTGQFYTWKVSKL